MNKKQIYASVLQLLTSICGIDFTKKFDTRLRFHRSLDLKNPKTLADKVSYLELHRDTTLQSLCTDKYEVRKYIAECGLEELLVPLAGGPWENADDVDFDALPNEFVLKATHGCKMNYIVKNKALLNKTECRNEMNRWLETTYGTYSLEPHYVSIPHRIYAEEYLGDMSGLVDYKFHCLNGEPEFILTVSDRQVSGDSAMVATLDLFDLSWNPIKEVVGARGEKAGNGSVSKPRHLDEMIEIARTLAKKFDFVRVDLYEINDRVYFGELTFSPACCVFPYLSEQFLLASGEKLKI